MGLIEIYHFTVIVVINFIKVNFCQYCQNKILKNISFDLLFIVLQILVYQ